jgi:hypothetical protein
VAAASKAEGEAEGKAEGFEWWVGWAGRRLVARTAPMSGADQRAKGGQRKASTAPTEWSE